MSFHAILILGIWMLLCRVRYAYYTIQYSCLDIELHGRVTWPWVGRPLDKVCGLKIIGRLFETRTATGSEHFACWETNVSQVGKKYLVMWMRLSEGELQVKKAHFRLPSAFSETRVLKPPIARGVPVVPNVPGDTVMVDSSTSGKASANNAKATLRRVAEQLLTFANRGGLYCWFLARGGGVLPKKNGYGCAARFPKPLPYLWAACRLIYDQNLRFSLPYLWAINDLTKYLIPYLWLNNLLVTKMAAKWLKLIPYLWAERLKNPTLWGHTYLYSPY